MSSSSFQKNQPVPIPVSQGGTGLSTIPAGGVVVGAGAGNVATIAPGASGNVLQSDGTNWTSVAAPTPSDGSLTYSKIALDLTQSIDMGASNNIDWSTGGIFNKNLTSSTSITFSNYQLNKSIVIRVTGNYPFSLPSTVKNINGNFDGNTTNYIFLHCTKSTSGQEVWASVNQKFPTYGYFSGGYLSGSVVNITDRIVFSTGVTSANTVSNLPQTKYGLTGISDLSTYGYFSGGSTGAVGDGTEHVTTTHRIMFSTGSTALNTTSNLSQARTFLMGISGLTYGYFSGGYIGTSSAVNTTDRLLYSTSATSANTVSNLSTSRYGLAGLSDAAINGYFGGGMTAAGAITSIADKIVFSTSVTSANTVSNLSQAKSLPTGISDGVTYGYFVGGNTGAIVATTDRIVFSTSVTSANTVSNLNIAKTNATSASDGMNYGYLSGGNTGSDTLTSSRIIFSTGIFSANTVSNLSQARSNLAGISDCAV